MKQINQKKIAAKSILIMVSVLIIGFQAQAQKVGDNLGNHTANQDLKMSGKDILNAKDVTATGAVNTKDVNATGTVTANNVTATNNVSVTNANGIVIGAATFTNTSVSLELKGDKALLINRVTDTSTIAAADVVDGMMIFANNQHKFYFRSNGIWQTFAGTSAGTAVLSITPGAVGGNANASGFSLFTTGSTTSAVTGDLTLLLQPANASYPGVVTSGPQIFGGNKKFADAVTLGYVPISTDTTNKLLVVDGISGNIMASNMNVGLIGKAIVQVPAGTSALLTPNTFLDVILTVAGVKADDGIVVNIKKSDRALFAGLTIKNATATNDNEVTVCFEDERNPDPSLGYTVPAIDGKSLVVTWMHRN